MNLQPKTPEISHETMKLIVGVIALTLAVLTNFFADDSLTSISESYHVGGWARNIFVGYLFAISAFLLAYNGYGPREMSASKIAAVAALLIAMFPCGCGMYDEIIRGVHGAAAAIMFGILAYLCKQFSKRAKDKGHREALRRSNIYVACGWAIVACIAVLLLDNFFDGFLSTRVPRLTFIGEEIALTAFGVSWLTASKIIPGLANSNERLRLLGGTPAPDSGTAMAGQREVDVRRRDAA